ncbi:MAG: methyltransferase domain-containing protein [Nautiliaceae bacterium]
MKQTLYKIYGFLHSLKYPFVLKEAIYSIFDEKVENNRFHMELAGEWLLYMQNSDGGYSRKFSFISGRDKSYIETTGYIIPSLINLGEHLNEGKFINSALKAGEFLLKVQNSNGSFSEIDTNRPFVFDTGQCLIGLNFLYEYTKENKYLIALKKAANWLKDVQESDGSWERFAYNQEKHTYYSRVAAAMLKSAKILEDKELENAALKNIKWVLDNQIENGFFRYSSFLKEKPPFLHTLMYVLEGLLDIYEITKDEEVLKAVLRNSEQFKNINLNRDLILCSQYNEKFECVNKQRCVTGLAQWAGVALRIYDITKDEDYKECAINTVFYLKAKQLKSSVMRGGFSASVPFWGRYGSFDFVNWNNKFFIDSMLLYERLKLPKVKEQESFVGSAFNISSSVVTDELSYMDKKYIEKLKKILPKNKRLTVLDVGYGKGVIIRELQKEYPLIEFVGVDPVFSDETIKKGSVYNLPFEDNEFDIVLVFEVLQHTYLKEALKEIYRVLKRNGKIIIGERNPISFLGLLKPILELKGKWMYPFDSPFREKWYFKNEWIDNLKRAGLEVNDIDVIEGSGKKFVNRYYFIEGSK